MPIVSEHKGDVFKTAAQTVVCTVNLVGVMGAGVAKAYKEKYPAAFLSYKTACVRGFSVGQLLLQRLPDGRLGLCFPTKKHWKNGSELEWIEIGLQKLLATYKQLGITSMAFPPLGCGNGGLDYKTQVRPLMFKYLSQMEDVTIEICY